MSDKMTPEQRHRCMSHVRSKDTKPEMTVRRYLFVRGFRYRIHVKNLPGKPDIVLRKYRAVIFVNRCFWHGHEGAALTLSRNRTWSFGGARLSGIRSVTCGKPWNCAPKDGTSSRYGNVS